jgi:hypothetical protein
MAKRTSSSGASRTWGQSPQRPRRKARAGRERSERKLSGTRALVTGASSGIGAELARQLADLGADLIITARRAERLEELAAQLRDGPGVEVGVIAADLAKPGAAAALFDQAAAIGPIDILVNNAGFGGYQSITDTPVERVLDMIDLNVRALTELTCRFVPVLLERERGYVLNVGSLVAWLPIPRFASYCGTKAYVRNFSESLSAELKGTGVTVTCLSPGATATEFLEVAGQKRPPVKSALMSPARCARIGIKAMLRGKRQVIAGGSNKLIALLAWLLPRRAVGAIAGRVIGEPIEPRTAGETAA